MKDIFALRLYTRVARLGDFSGAARECELSQSQASRIIADLESDLGTRLLSRGAREPRNPKEILRHTASRAYGRHTGLARPITSPIHDNGFALQGRWRAGGTGKCH